MVQNPQSTARLEDVGGSDGSRRRWQQDLTRLQNGLSVTNVVLKFRV